MTLPVLVGADEAERELDCYRSRLADPTLLGAAVAVRLGGSTYLAVPTGGLRRGG